MNANTIIKLAKKLGISQQDLQTLLQKRPHTTTSISFAQGPNDYLGGYYGTISLHDFS